MMHHCQKKQQRGATQSNNRGPVRTIPFTYITVDTSFIIHLKEMIKNFDKFMYGFIS